MRFNYSVIRNFRNFSGPELKTKWGPGINLILGSNGSGKTNLLESLSVLCGWGGFTRTQNILSWNVPARAEAFADVGGEESFKLSASIASRVSLRLNDKAISFTDLRLVIPSIIFLTGGVSLIDGSPSARRLFIDRLCALLVPPYAKRLADFKYVMRSRTALLRQRKSPAPTTEIFCKLGGWIMERRREVLEMLKGVMKQDKFEMKFLPELQTSGDEYLRRAIEESSARELHVMRPLVGPGYEELAITLRENSKPVSEALSRGQKRRLILYMITTAGKLTALKLKRKPILLFDDFTAELDAPGREWTYKKLIETGCQVFITAPEDPFGKKRSVNRYHL